MDATQAEDRVHVARSHHENGWTVAVDLLPECTAGSETCPVDAVDSDRHRFQDTLRTHAALSSLGGSAAVVLAWVGVVL